jgi:hypothetical protein
MLYKETVAKRGDCVMSHIKFCQELVMELVGEDRAGRESRIGRSSTSGKEPCLDSKLNLLMPHPEEKLKDYAVCSERKEEKWHESRFIYETCN